MLKPLGHQIMFADVQGLYKPFLPLALGYIILRQNFEIACAPLCSILYDSSLNDNTCDIEHNLIQSSQKHCIYLKLIRIVSIQSKSTGFEIYLDEIKKNMISFHYHQKCQDITDNRDDIELDLIESSQNTVFT